jgi:hypothetical protein
VYEHHGGHWHGNADSSDLFFRVPGLVFDWMLHYPGKSGDARLFSWKESGSLRESFAHL